MPLKKLSRRWRLASVQLMHSWGFALREGVFAKPKEIYIASLHALTAWPATCPRLSPILPSASWTTFLLPQWQAALARVLHPISQPPPRAGPSLQYAMEATNFASFLVR